MPSRDGSARVDARQPTRAQDVYDALRMDILNGQLVPGSRLRFEDLGRRYESSVGATREALARLVSERLLTVRPRQGYHVATLSHDDLADLIEARAEIEPLAVLKSVAAGDMAWESRLVAAHHVLTRVPFLSEGAAMPNGEWAEAHRTFHLALTAACTNTRLLDFATALREQAVLYQLWSLAGERIQPSSAPDAHRAPEHHALLEAAKDRDGDRAARLTREHILETGRLAMTGGTAGVESTAP